MKTENVFYSSRELLSINEVPEGAEITDKVVLLKVTVRGSDFSRAVLDDVFDGSREIDRRMVSVKKQLIDKSYLTDITRYDSWYHGCLKKMGFKYDLLGDGVIMLPLSLVTEAYNILQRWQGARTSAVKRLRRNYEKAKADARSRCPDLYRESEYPKEEELDGIFSLDYKFFSVSLPAVMEQVRSDVWKEERVKAESSWRSTVEEVQQALRTGFKELVSSMSDKIRGINERERKVFKEGFVRDFKFFLDTFDAKNLTNDIELKALVDQARSVLDGVSPEMIRSNVETRVVVENNLKAIEKSLDEMIVRQSRVRRMEI